MSSSQGLSPWNADDGNAWWLWCHDSPNEIHDSHQTLRDSSLTRNRREPTKWQTELTDQVMWCRRKMRIRPPQNIACRPAPSVPPQIQPATNGAISETATQSGNIREMKTMPRSASRSFAYFVHSARPMLRKSQPTCACQRPAILPRIPGAKPACGECGSPSRSAKLWCLRWSETQRMTGPWTAIEPSTASP